MNIEELEYKIRYYAEKYYKGEPEISDELFDSLVDQLRSLKPNSKVLTTGWGFEVDGDKVKHKYVHIGSLDKTKTFQDIPNRFKGKKIYISPKLDGLSAVVYYENGKLVKAITRGNGVYGKDITTKISMIEGTQINDKSFTGAIRGELIIHDDNWLVLQNKYTNLIAPRNFAAGIVNRKEIDEDIQFLHLVVYKVVGQENKPLLNTKGDMINWLQQNFKHCIPNFYYPILNEQSWNEYHTQTFEEFNKLGYLLDGLVLSDSTVLYNNQTMGYLLDEVAFKFGAESSETIIKNIEWTLSRTQRLVPVAVVEPVELSGAVIERATCNNAQMVRDMGLGAGAVIEIQRSNEVIPQIINVISESSEQLPQVCPICKHELKWDGVDLKCNNDMCPNIALSDLQQWCENIGETDGLQWTLMKQYLDLYKIKSIQDLYDKQNIVWNDLNNRKLSITEEKIKEFFNKLYFSMIPANKALTGLNIPRLGNKTSELLAQQEDLVLNYWYNCYIKIHRQDLYDPSIEDKIRSQLTDIVKEATTYSLMHNYRKFINLRFLSNDVTKWNLKRIIFDKNINEYELKYVAVTGSLNTMKRKDFESYIKQYGYELSSNLKKCEYLITNDPNSGSSKNKQAKEYGVKIITEVDFINTLK